MISDKHTQMFLSICNFGEKAVTALSRMQPPNDTTSVTLPSPFQTTAGISRSEWHAGWHFYFANSHKHLSLLSSGRTVSSKWSWQSIASTHPTWNKPDFEVWMIHSIPWMHPLVSLPSTELIGLHASDINVWQGTKSQDKKSTSLQLLLV